MSRRDPWMQACISGRGMGAFKATIAPIPPAQQKPTNEREVILNGARLCIEYRGTGLTESYYRVRLLDGKWPDRMALFGACDGGTVFGGKMKFADDDPQFAEVTVWID